MAKQKSDDELLDDVSALSSGVYLNAADVKDGDLTFAIESVSIETFDKDGKKQRRLVLAVAGDPPRRLSLNETNRLILCAAWGTAAKQWVGYVFDCWYDPSVRSPAGAKTGGLRVKPRTITKPATVGKPNGSGATVDSAADPIPF